MSKPPILPAQSAQSVNILIVDDQPNNLLTLSQLLDHAGFTVRQAIDGQMALDTVQAIAPDLILLDIRMPVMDGYEVCTQLKSNQATHNIPVIFLSALDDVLDKTKAFSVGGADYITKPFQVEEVLVRVQHQLTIQSQQKQLLHLNQQLQHLNNHLERQVQLRTIELEQALLFERTLKRISDQVRDTLDPSRILQAAVTELSEALECTCCDAVLYSPDRLTSTIRYQSLRPGQLVTQGEALYMADAPEIYDQLHQRHWFAFCQLQPTPIRNHSAILACPIFDHQVDHSGILGDLWLFKPTYSSFGEREIHLVEQVANQCAIALRQARLYETSQQQVQELERLNQLKDDFLSTISHELRSPLANMKMALQMLDILTEQGQTLSPELVELSFDGRANQYFEILKQECDRELQLVKDLLDLQHLEAGVHVFEPVNINLQDWLHHLTETFQLRMQTQQQVLVLEIAPDFPLITIDVPSLSRVVTELLTNACKYTPAHGQITISAHLEDVDRLCLRICNTGVEIPPAELSRIFHKFYRVPNNDPWKHGGTGLGLALIHKLVEQLGGTIEVASQDAVTCFTVCVPIHA